MFKVEFRTMFYICLFFLVISQSVNASDKSENLKVLKVWVLENQASDQCQYSDEVSLLVRYVSLDSSAIIKATLMNDGYVNAIFEEPVAMGMHDAHLQFNAGNCVTDINVTIISNDNENEG